MPELNTPRDAAERLRDAYTNGPVEPLRDVLAPTDSGSAYEIQSINTDYWREQGRQITGWKIGLTASAVQQQLGVNQPDFGVLFSDMQIANGGSLDMSRVIQPRGEAEIALVLDKDIDSADVTADDLRDTGIASQHIKEQSNGQSHYLWVTQQSSFSIRLLGVPDQGASFRVHRHRIGPDGVFSDT